MIPPRTRGVALLLAVLPLLLSGCSFLGTGDQEAGARPTPRPVTTGGSTTSQDAPDPALAPYYSQRLHWTSCRDSDQCATLRVPLDYAQPGGRSIRLALLRVPAVDQRARLGSMVVNPGGPGGSGVDYAASADSQYGEALRRVFDVVGFDPRGVGASAPVECVSARQLDRFVASDPDPVTAAERTASDRLVRELGDGCLKRDGAVTRHVSTVEVAKDLDVLRAALGDPKLTYFGASYGTSIGATYADLFPRNVGRMVLDGALDPASSTLEVNLVQARGFEGALRAYVGACVARGSCFLGDSVEAGTRRIAAFLHDVERRPLTTASGATLTAGTAVYGVWYPLYDKGSWPILDKALADAFTGNGSLLRTIADAYLHRSPDGKYADNSFQAFYAVTCLDRDDGIPSSEVQRYLPRFEKVSPTFGAIFAYSMSACDSWPVHSGRAPKALHVTAAPPVLVVGTTRDPATPLVWARALSRQLKGSVLVQRDGDGHTGYNRGSPCTDRTVEAYLVSGTVPRHEVDCS